MKANALRRWLFQGLIPVPLLTLAGCSFQPVRPASPGTQIVSPVVVAQAAPGNATDGPPTPSTIPPHIARTPNAVPKPEPRSRYGNPPKYTVFGKTYKVRDSSTGFTQVGYASWYGRKFQGKRTASGERYDMFKMTAAHKTLPIPSYVKVTNLGNGKSCVVRINDRGPFHKGRVIDLSYAAAARLGMLHHGTAKVELQAITPAQPTFPTIPPTITATGLHTVSTRSAQTAAARAKHRYLQVGVFLEHDNAEALRDRLEGVGVEPLSMVLTQYEGAPATRVLVGPMAGKQQLQAMRQQLAGEGIPSEPVTR